jgi:hypothetical protein
VKESKTAEQKVFGWAESWAAKMVFARAVMKVVDLAVGLVVLRVVW